MSRLCDGAIGLEVKHLVPCIAAVLALCAVAASTAIAASAGPHWSIVSESQPTRFGVGGSSDAYVVIVRNDGAEASARGSAVSVTDALPAVWASDGPPSEVTATKVEAAGEGANGGGSPRYTMSCPGGPVTKTVTCTYEESATQGRVLAGAMIVVTIAVSIPEGAKALGPNTATVSGGGAPSASTSETTAIDPAPAPFGVSFFDVDTAGESGEADTQAGSHPFELTTSLAFDTAAREVPSEANGESESSLADASVKDLSVVLPPGLVGNPNAVPRCSQQAFLERAGECPLDTQVGTVKPSFYGAFHPAVYPVYDIVPPPGQPAELGFSVAGIGHIPILFHVRSNRDYGLTASLSDIPEAGPWQGTILTLWGVPAAASHDLEREGTLGEDSPENGKSCQPRVTVEGGVEDASGCPSGVPARAFLTLPSACQSSPLGVGLLSDSWQEPAPAFRPLWLWTDADKALTGCEQLSFDPSLSLVPETTQAGAPSGYTLDLHLPQNEDPTALATPDLRRATVSLPAGVVLSPSFANGLQACSWWQFAPHSSLLAACPGSSQIGTVSISTPLLSSPLEGQVFLGEPGCGPCSPRDAREGRLVRLLLQAQGSGVTVKLAGAASIDQATGQVTASFDESPQLPFEDMKLTLDGGPDAPLANPASCGAPLAASSQLTPYSSETPAQPSSRPFALSGCSPAQFAPSFVAGTSNNRAAAFSPLTVSLSRSDRDEDLQALSVRLPPGLLAMLSNISPCPTATAQTGQCGAQSEVGTATVGAGPGSKPLMLDGSVYLTGPYEGAPFGLSIVVPVVAGPFDLGTVEVGARIEVSPSTAALTIVSDPLPQSLDGIPLQIKTLDLDIDREGFVFNPTDCGRLAVEGALDGSAGATAAASSPFQAADCAKLRFKPRLTALTHAKTSKAGGVYLHVRLVSAPGQANIAKLKVDLPKRMSTRLSTLQKACTAVVFEANPAGCPASSVLGTATVLTPILREPLTGPVLAVSRGRLASPEIALVLQGENVQVDVVGQSSVEHGITAGIFRSLPDAPISALELVLDEGPHSLLAANLPTKARGSMCAHSLSMGIALTAQNGAVVKQTVKVAVSGCPRRRARTR